MKVAVDTGGTFTDFVYKEGEVLRFFKVSSHPENPAKAILEGLREVLKVPSPQILIHGSTVATNAFLERKGVDFALFTTRGFEDLIFIGRQARPKLYDFFVEKPRPFIKPENILGLKERVSAKGEIIKPLDKEEILRAKAWLIKKGLSSCAISFLHSYRNPVHENLLKEQLLEIPGLSLTTSFEILPEFREFERTTTTAINAYLNPIMQRYLSTLRKELKGTTIFMQQSSGGYMTLEEAAKFSIHTILSGPAGGVQGAFLLAEQLGERRIITFDMGGTSTDVSLIDRALPYTREYELDGFPVRIPVLDVHTVGAGGGSIAYIDEGGILKVGPQSAGADPGPACYGKGMLPTVTDANLVLGRLLPDYFCGGKKKLYPEKAFKALKGLAERLGRDLRETALAIIRIANIHMTKAITKVSLEKGYDPREFTLLVFGGAGGLHACALARELGISRIIVPKLAPVFSAFGLYFSTFTKEFSQTLILPLEERELWKGALKSLKKKAEIYLLQNRGSIEEMEWEYYVDLRYAGQGYELTIPWEEPLKEVFEREHERLFGFFLKDHPLEVVTLRLRAKERTKFDGFRLEREYFLFPSFETKLFTDEGERIAKVIPWDSLSPADTLKGPALVVDAYTTFYLESDFNLEVLSGYHLLVRKDGYA